MTTPQQKPAHYMKYTHENNGNDSESKLCDKTLNQMLLHEEE